MRFFRASTFVLLLISTLNAHARALNPGEVLIRKSDYAIVTARCGKDYPAIYRLNSQLKFVNISNTYGLALYDQEQRAIVCTRTNSAYLDVYVTVQLAPDTSAPIEHGSRIDVFPGLSSSGPSLYYIQRTPSPGIEDPLRAPKIRASGNFYSQSEPSWPVLFRTFPGELLTYSYDFCVDAPKMATFFTDLMDYTADLELPAELTALPGPAKVVNVDGGETHAEVVDGHLKIFADWIRTNRCLGVQFQAILNPPAYDAPYYHGGSVVAFREFTHSYKFASTLKTESASYIAQEPAGFYTPPATPTHYLKDITWDRPDPHVVVPGQLVKTKLDISSKDGRGTKFFNRMEVTATLPVGMRKTMPELVRTPTCQVGSCDIVSYDAESGKLVLGFSGQVFFDFSLLLNFLIDWDAVPGAALSVGLKVTSLTDGLNERPVVLPVDGYKELQQLLLRVNTKP